MNDETQTEAAPKRPREERRLDSLARLLEAGSSSTCVAIAVFEGRFLLAENDFHYGMKGKGSGEPENVARLKNIYGYFQKVANKTDTLDDRKKAFKQICEYTKELSKSRPYKDKVGDEVFNRLIEDILAGRKADILPREPDQAAAYAAWLALYIIFEKVEKLIHDHRDDDKDDESGEDIPLAHIISALKKDSVILNDQIESGVHAELQILHRVVCTMFGYPVNPEGKILDSITSKSPTKIYLGISKLCCLKCRDTIHRVNALMKHDHESLSFFQARGFHEEQAGHKNWVPPDFISEGGEFSIRLRELLDKECQKELEVISREQEARQSETAADESSAQIQARRPKRVKQHVEVDDKTALVINKYRKLKLQLFSCPYDFLLSTDDITTPKEDVIYVKKTENGFSYTIYIKGEVRYAGEITWTQLKIKEGIDLDSKTGLFKLRKDGHNIFKLIAKKHSLPYDQLSDKSRAAYLPGYFESLSWPLKGEGRMTAPPSSSGSWQYAYSLSMLEFFKIYIPDPDGEVHEIGKDDEEVVENVRIALFLLRNEEFMDYFKTPDTFERDMDEFVDALVEEAAKRSITTKNRLIKEALMTFVKNPTLAGRATAQLFSPGLSESPMDLGSRNDRSGSAGSARSADSGGSVIHLSDDLIVTRNEIQTVIEDSDSDYTADFINVLLYSAIPRESVSIKTYPAITIDQLKDIATTISEQTENYAFIPVNIHYGEITSKYKNHWIAIIVDKAKGNIFCLDPAVKIDSPQKVPAEIIELRTNLGYTTPVILNLIDFQKKERDEGFVRHCGAYVIEIFAAFKKAISEGRIISIELYDTDSISVDSVLSVIPSGEADKTQTIRRQHSKVVTETLASVRAVPVTANKTNDDNDDEQERFGFYQ